MGPAVALAGLLAVSLLVLGATLRRSARPLRRPAAPFPTVVPWIVVGVLLVGAVPLVIPGVPPIVLAGLLAYTVVAVSATWRMASLDRVSPWMEPSRRRARLGLAAVGLTWLGIVLGLLLGIADMLANAQA